MWGGGFELKCSVPTNSIYVVLCYRLGLGRPLCVRVHVVDSTWHEGSKVLQSREGGAREGAGREGPCSHACVAYCWCVGGTDAMGIGAGSGALSDSLAHSLWFRCVAP